jgi:hypothetical protein
MVGLLSPLKILRARGERVNIDFVTKLPVTKIRNDTIITIIDGLTKKYGSLQLRNPT